MKEELRKYPVVVKLPVQWGEMDVAGHINNLIYLRWTESGRIVYFEKMGMDTSFTSGEAGPILGWQDCKYIFPMTYPDTAIIGIRTIEVNDKFLIMESAVFSEKYQRIAAISPQKIVPYSYEKLSRIEMPESWREGIAKLKQN
ncbi:MAG: acyl-CoA thioester hydrolase [Saprospiraceae bacterium]|jgi:acyl-CoA thioester hydrolase